MIWTLLYVLLYIPFLIMIITGALSRIIPNEKSFIRYKCVYLFGFFWLHVTTLTFLPLNLIGIPITGRNCRVQTSFANFCLNLKVLLIGKENLPVGENCVIMANHQSAVDIFAYFTIWPILGKCSPIAKRELLYILPFGLSAYLSNVVFVPRGNHEKNRQILDNIIKSLKKTTVKIICFPEGTRNSKRLDSFLPFKKGLFLMAIRTQIPIVPMVYAPAYFENASINFFSKNAEVVIEVLEPIPTTGLTESDVDTLIDITRIRMLACYHKYLEKYKTRFGPDYPGFYGKL